MTTPKPKVIASGLFALIALATAAISQDSLKITVKNRNDPADNATSLNVIPLRQLYNADVLSPKGDNVGCAADFIADLDTGKLAYLVIFTKGMPRDGDKLTTMPMTAVEFRREGDKLSFKLTISAQQFNALPSARGKWPNFSSPQQQPKVDRSRDNENGPAFAPRGEARQQYSEKDEGPDSGTHGGARATDMLFKENSNMRDNSKAESDGPDSDTHGGARSK